MTAARLTLSGIAPALLLVACSAERAPPAAISLCDLRQQAEHLVQLTASIEVTAAGTTVIGDPRCPAEQIELRLTQAAYRTGFPDKLKAALLSARAATPPKRVVASMTGILAPVVDGGVTVTAFTAEALGEPTLQ